MILDVAKEYKEAVAKSQEKNERFDIVEFRINVIEPAYNQSLINHEKLTVLLDCDQQYPFGFFFEIFGGLVTSGYDADQILATMEFIAVKEPKMIEDIYKYIKICADNVKSKHQRIMRLKHGLIF